MAEGLDISARAPRDGGGEPDQVSGGNSYQLQVDSTSESQTRPAEPARLHSEDRQASHAPSMGALSNARTLDPEKSASALPRLKKKETKLAQKEAHPWQHLGITLGLPMILIFDLVIPCIIYYTWYDSHKSDWQRQCHEEYPGQHPCPILKPEFDENILGSAIASFGVGELWILLARMYRLYFHRDDCAPLLSRNRWELDATSWVYGAALIVSLIPFVVASKLAIPKLYLYSPAFLMTFLGCLMVITTLYPFKIPIGINSQARGTRLRPFIYYAAEDFIAVDGLQDREFRVRYNDRYETNKAFRRLFVYLTLWWMLGICVYIGCLSAVIWTLPFHIAFGLSLGILFSWIAVWAATTFVWVKIEIEREHKAYEAGTVEE
ncbi:hypothetical protein LTR10_021488 [Elasticomyces elasticus]|uniref:Uncharacterized protein n=1 Tax=Exophiala sideris TaxID=1016849 RepID=A0ABR0J9Y9_9EURO|nr:hypothetical protein LTR10_021488 [Elasticomyces elasticus]KAK5027806.1 hypothetical protein LTS07_006681 [Exophiala sideris]KAK5037606.1 hypothetical protein LTR13_004765 [Exophiala sideris]KAK5059268.1 hypothetical protein LTR69_006558 [Exophiala sideris]KAK5183102.1 hypothetical protein LTR44_004813 [Eurotiomycetes sp. CCFEE 6388]